MPRIAEKFLIDKILPVRLSPFEEYLFLDQKPGFPMSENIDWVFQGQVDRELLEKALWKVVAKEPLFFAKVKKKWGKYYWTAEAKDEMQPVQWIKTDHDFLEDRCGMIPLIGIDLEKKPGVQIFVVEGKGSFLIRTHFHHAVVDGLGATIFMGNWFSIYEQLLLQKADGDPILTDPQSFRFREDLHIVAPEPVSASVILKTLIVEVFKWFWRRPISLIPLKKRREKESSKIVSSFVRDVAEDLDRESDWESAWKLGRKRENDLDPVQYWRSIPYETWEKYHKKAKEKEVSINTLLLRDLYLALRRWSQLSPREERRNRRFFRVLVPMSMRKKEHGSLPLANILGYIFLDELPRNCDREDDLLKKINEIMKFVRKWSSGSLFIEGARFFRRFPGMLSLLTSRIFCHSSIVFSNTGILCKCLQSERYREEMNIRIPGELELIRIIGSPPVRPNTPISIGLITHQKEMLLTFCVDRHVFDQESFLEFFDLYYSEIEKTIQE